MTKIIFYTFKNYDNRYYIENFCCPLCFSLIGIDDININEYTGSNVLLNCENCKELLLCLCGENPKYLETLNKKKNDLEQICENNITDPSSKCTCKISYVKMISYFLYIQLFSKNNQIKQNALRSVNKFLYHKKSSYFETSLLEIIKIKNLSIPGIISFSDIKYFDNNIDLNYDNVRLDYEGKCSECNIIHNSYIMEI